jgi:hypothetical protein
MLLRLAFLLLGCLTLAVLAAEDYYKVSGERDSRTK